jgi:hypothetical protein
VKVSAVVRETGLPVRWVHRAARRWSGNVYHEEDASCPADPCAWCDALRWVLSHAEDVRRDEAASDRRSRLNHIHERTVASVTWKRENYDLLEFLEEMLAGDFRDAALRAVERGTVSPSMEAAVRESVRRRPVPPPAVGVWVDVIADVCEAAEVVNKWGKPVLRIDFLADDGWRGRVDVTDPPMMRAWRGTKPSTSFAVKGRVIWRVDRMAVIESVGALSPVQREGS